MLFDTMGFGKGPDEPVPIADPAALGPTFKAPLMLLAKGLGADIEDFEFHREVALADRAIDVKAGMFGRPRHPDFPRSADHRRATRARIR